MENEDKPCCAADALRRIRQVKINGIMTGITMLDQSIAAVRAEGLTSETAIREALMKRVNVYNYVPPAVENHYAEALMEEYRNVTKKNEQ
ncbi:hypothetical protein [Methanoregula formicica]|uniref:Uncharacterized protein n=1 Tax=Methanoregula formicica (strain DSM 22288 / NBRC 105244 / SMSP) TaxID=593750 RepID=L0HK79_METFS|nr:hypothetical protein [Methanoregula formicica]AGB03713.1 hypothetical protein Metfor_2728 [Methanoregula formicica SMSP]